MYNLVKKPALWPAFFYLFFNSPLLFAQNLWGSFWPKPTFLPEQNLAQLFNMDRLSNQAWSGQVGWHWEDQLFAKNTQLNFNRHNQITEVKLDHWTEAYHLSLQLRQQNPNLTLDYQGLNNQLHHKNSTILNEGYITFNNSHILLGLYQQKDQTHPLAAIGIKGNLWVYWGQYAQNEEGLYAISFQDKDGQTYPWQIDFDPYKKAVFIQGLNWQNQTWSLRWQAEKLDYAQSNQLLEKSQFFARVQQKNWQISLQETSRHQMNQYHAYYLKNKEQAPQGVGIYQWQRYQTFVDIRWSVKPLHQSLLQSNHSTA